MGHTDLSITEVTSGVDLLHRPQETCHYEPDGEILGGYDTNIHVVGRICPDTEIEYKEGEPNPIFDDDIKVILSIPLEMYLDIQKAWLSEKLDYCNRYGHYCGVFLGMDCIGVDLGVKVTISNGWNDEGNDYNLIELPIYQIISFDPTTCDPEHG